MDILNFDEFDNLLLVTIRQNFTHQSIWLPIDMQRIKSPVIKCTALLIVHIYLINSGLMRYDISVLSVRI